MDAKIIDIVRTTFDLSDDIKQLKAEMERAENFSAEKQQIQYMLSQICVNANASDNDRVEAARVLIQNSDLRAAIKSVPHKEILIDEMIQAVKHGGVRH